MFYPRPFHSTPPLLRRAGHFPATPSSPREPRKLVQPLCGRGTNPVVAIAQQAGDTSMVLRAVRRQSRAECSAHKARRGACRVGAQRRRRCVGGQRVEALCKALRRAQPHGQLVPQRVALSAAGAACEQRPQHRQHAAAAHGRWQHAGSNEARQRRERGAAHALLLVIQQL
eukprot:354037-Chlamydomonas_euryale.AAC.2